MPTSFDVIVIGSGFGGAIMARRLAEQGMRVLVLERGRRWEPSQYPRKPDDAWIFSDEHPALLHGWLDMRFYRGMTVAQAAGVGGGSLTYSSVAVEAHPDVFTQGWPVEITHQELKPYYDTVAREMDSSGASRRPADAAFRDRPRRSEEPRLRESILQGSPRRQLQRGLELPARGSVQSQTLASVHQRARAAPGDVHPPGQLRHRVRRAREERARRQLHPARRAERRRGAAAASGARTSSRPVAKYRVVFDRIEHGRLIRGEEIADRVVLAAGSLGTTEILLRCRDQYKTLPSLSPTLGTRWSANANFISMAVVLERRARQAVDRSRRSRASWTSLTAASGTSVSSSRTTAFRTRC